MKGLLRLNLRGHKFQTSSEKLREIIYIMAEKGNAFTQENDEYFVDRNPIIFQSVLDYYSTEEFHLPKNVCSVQARQEIQFWKIPNCHVPMCCYKTLYDDEIDEYKTLEKSEAVNDNKVSTKGHEKENLISNIRKRLLHAQHRPSATILGKVWLACVILVSMSSLAGYVINSSLLLRIPRVDIPYQGNFTRVSRIYNPKEIILGTTQIAIEFASLEIICNCAILLDILIKFAISYHKWTFFISESIITDIIGCLASSLFLYFDRHPDKLISNPNRRTIQTTLGMMYSLRMFRILRLAELNPCMRILKLSFIKSWRVFLFLVISFLSFATIFGSMMYWAEFTNADTFPDFFICIWWAIVTMTTVGYGDQVPTTINGYIVGSIASCFGLLLLAMPVTVLGSRFNTLYECYKCKTLHNSSNSMEDEKRSSKIQTKSYLKICDKIKNVITDFVEL